MACAIARAWNEAARQIDEKEKAKHKNDEEDEQEERPDFYVHEAGRINGSENVVRYVKKGVDGSRSRIERLEEGERVETPARSISLADLPDDVLLRVWGLLSSIQTEKKYNGYAQFCKFLRHNRVKIERRNLQNGKITEYVPVYKTIGKRKKDQKKPIEDKINVTLGCSMTVPDRHGQNTRVRVVLNYNPKDSKTYKKVQRQIEYSREIAKENNPDWHGSFYIPDERLIVTFEPAHLYLSLIHERLSRPVACLNLVLIALVDGILTRRKRDSINPVSDEERWLRLHANGPPPSICKTENYQQPVKEKGKDR